jgi:hypothetical protein
MTHSPSPREPLTPEEQALARRIAQLGPQGEPSPALDARVLAAARADEARGRRSSLRPRPWPVALGVAASLVLAIGLAWRLRPLPVPIEGAASTDTARQQPAASSAQEKTTGEPAAAFVLPPPRDVALPAVRPEAPAPVESQPARVAAAPEPVQPMPPPEPPVVLEAPAAPMAAEALPAPPPPAEPRTEAGSNAAKTLDRVDVTGSHIRRSDNAAAEQAAEESGFDAAAAADQAAGDEPMREVPPATADSPEVREAWLQRIRELVAAGQTEAARASLKEFVRRHPDASLPDDLRALQR